MFIEGTRCRAVHAINIETIKKEGGVSSSHNRRGDPRRVFDETQV